VATLTATDVVRLGTVRPQLRTALLGLMDAAESLGYQIAIAPDGGTRDNARQAALYADALAQGGGLDTAYAVAKPGHSRHEYGAAFDVQIVAGGASDRDYRQLADVAPAFGLVAGYYFDARGVGKHDPYHFQLDESLATSVALWQTITPSVGGVTVALLAVAIVVALLMRTR
jgi:hypothetical protein